VEKLVVTAHGLHLRELPEGDAKSLVILPFGQEVERLDQKIWAENWYRITAILGGLQYHGYSSARFLKPVDARGAVSADTLAEQLAEMLDVYATLIKQKRLVTTRRRDMIGKLAPAFAAGLPSADIVFPGRMAHFFAQCALETDYFGTLEEYANGKAYNPPKPIARKLGNTEKGDGPRFKGRGCLQLTGRTNYANASQGMGLGEALIERPERVSAEPDLAVRTALWYWTRNNVNAVADRRGVLAEVSLAVSRAVNLGDPDHRAKPHHVDERRRLTEAGLLVFARAVS
jgi:predicted chitinase